MYEELIKRLRRGWTKPIATPSEFMECADIIEALVAENARLKEIIRREAWLEESK